MKRKNIKLSSEAYDFLNLINTTHSARSVAQHESCIRCLFRFLNEEKIEFKYLNRSHIERWLIWMKNEGHQSPTRFLRIMSIRYFLRWCSDHGFLTEKQGQLIYKGDFPRRPKKLPRPFPPDLDQEIITRLKKTNTIMARAILLSRYTGIRNGEVRTLTRDCIHEELNGYKSLKVPLGKTNTERLVPLTEEAVQLIKEIQDITLKNVQAYAQQRKPICHECGNKAHQDLPSPSIQPDQIPKRLIVLCNGRFPSYSGCRSAWYRIIGDLRKKYNTPLTLHRLRHTYATSMLSGGMSIVSLMKILGHSDIRMTLVYGDVTKEKLHDEYFKALKNLNERYNIKALDVRNETIMLDPKVVLSDMIRWLDTNRFTLSHQPSGLRSILKRLKLIEKDLGPYSFKEKMPLPT